VAVSHLPLTERVLPAGNWRWLAIAGWSGLPFVRIAVFALLGAAAGLAPDAGSLVTGHVVGGLLNASVIALVLVGTGIVARQLDRLRTIGGEDTERLVRLNGSITLPLVIALLLVLLNTASHVQEFGLQAMVAAPLVFVIDFVLTLLFRIPQATAFYSSVIAVLTVAALGRHKLPGKFPEDRSLGLGSVGELLTTILVFYAAVFIPVLVFGTSGNVSEPRVTEFLLTLAMFGLGLAAILLAVWRTHRQMAAERSRQVEAARARYAAAYRRAVTDSDPAAGWALQKQRLLLDGAESIHQWPFDDRTQRILAVVLTGVVTGIVLRLAALLLGV